MFARLARVIFGTSNDRALKGYQRRVPQINALEPAMQALSTEALGERRFAAAPNPAQPRNGNFAPHAFNPLLPERSYYHVIVVYIKLYQM